MPRITAEGGSYLDWREGSGGTIEIYDLSVANEFRRRGIGRRMVFELLKNAHRAGVRTVYAITRSSNFIAQEFYEALKFRPQPLRNFYKDEPLAGGGKYTDAVMYIRDVGDLS